MLSSRHWLWIALLVGLSACGAGRAHAQVIPDYDPSWYDGDAPHVRIAVVEDGVYRVEAQDLTGALPEGTSLASIAPETLRLIENGTEVPLHLTGTGDGQLDPSDALTFVGARNRGTNELWAYDGDAAAQSSPTRSLYTDTTYYWLTWGGAAGRRYDTPPADPDGSPRSSVADAVHDERDRLYYFGRPFENNNAFYTESEGYYWAEFRHNDTDSIRFTHRLPVGRRVPSDAELSLRIRFDAQTASCHRVDVAAELQQGSSATFEPIGTAEWRGINRQTFMATVRQEAIPDDGLRLRLTSRNDAFSDPSCPDPASSPNFVLLDYIEASYTRSLTPVDGAQQWTAPSAGNAAFALSGYAADTVHVYNDTDGRRYAVPTSGGAATVGVSPSQAGTPFWAVGDAGFRSPAAVLPDRPSDWADASAHGADYLILTTQALLPAAQRLADYRRSQDGYAVEVALVQDVFDEFDYGRPTPLAIRRFVRATQAWDPAPQFLTIFADAQYPIYTGDIEERRPPWSVPSFGYSPSDGWFAMQTGGRDDFSEILAIGRIPVRSVAQGNLFIDKLQRYESAPLANWQKRMLLLAGGTNEGEQNRLQFYSNRWGEIASDTTASINGQTTRVHTGADTLRYYKKVNDALDASFQDSLAVDLRRGSVWLNYFGHSAAQTWEIVTDPPSEFDNAGRLPIVVSLGCRTGAFAGGRFEVKSAPSLGEQIVVGSVGPDGTPQPGAENGGIAHFGESALGNLLPSAQINDELIEAVFVDTSRVLGEAIRQSKAEIAAQFRGRSLYEKHLLQYGLLGDPATRIALPDQPDLHVTTDLIAVSPSAPTPAQDLSVAVRVQNRGLIPSDSVDVTLTWVRADGATTERQRRLPRLRLEERLTFDFSLDERALGTNTFRVQVDPANAIAEVDETNNTAEQTQVVFGTGVDLIAPVDYGTVPTRAPELTVSVTRQAAEAARVEVQVDTAADFSSPALQSTTLEVDGVRGSWQPSPPLVEGTAYVWRARLADAGPGDAQSAWREGHFTVRADLPGGTWLQQERLFSANANDQLERTGGDWAFASFPVVVTTNANRGQASTVNAFNVNGTANFEYLQFGFGILVIDGTTGAVRNSNSFPTYDLADQYEDDVGDGQAAVDRMRAFLDDTVERGDYVFVRTRHLARRSGPQISDEVKALFRRLGSSSSADAPHTTAIDTLTYDHVWAMKARKGFPAETVERVSPPSEAEEVNEINLESRLAFTLPSGTTTTPLIGPASAWDHLQWEATAPTPSGSVTIDVLARDSTVLIDDLRGLGGERSLAVIDAAQHPTLRLRATLADSTTRTAPQLTRWSVAHTGVPELVIDPSALRAIDDTLRQGATASVALPVTNLGAVESAPVRLRYDLTDASNVTTTVAVDTVGTLAPGAEATSTVDIETADRPGPNVLTVTATSDGPPERFTANNTVVRNFVVQRDQEPPSVTALVDGRELPPAPEPINNLQDPRLPFVSAEPTIELLIRDNNDFLRLQDTSLVEVAFKGGLPERGPVIGSQFREIPFASPQLEFQPPSDDGANEARVLFRPDLPMRDSTYTVKVEAEDAQGNALEPFQATFRVQQDQVVGDVYPYPNPMHTHTTFAFQVRGGTSRMLQDFRLRIYTLSGRLVRELDRTDLQAPLRVGWNLLRWNGRDADGDRVATGVYLYRVRIDGADETFESDIEKIAVIR